ncbi:hypothetical protein [Lederbergia sp. NSJ-179]|nr:hypothetical protein [Lederbergia sp. NSJ-179]
MRKEAIFKAESAGTGNYINGAAPRLAEGTGIPTLYNEMAVK